MPKWLSRWLARARGHEVKEAKAEFEREREKTTTFVAMVVADSPERLNDVLKEITKAASENVVDGE